MKNQKGSVNFLIITLVLLVIGGGVLYFNLSNTENEYRDAFLQKDKTADTNVASEKTTELPTSLSNQENTPGSQIKEDESKIRIFYPDGGEKIYYNELAYAGDLDFIWESSVEGYSPSSMVETFLLNESGEKIREDSALLVTTDEGRFHKVFMETNNIQSNYKYKVMVCDYVEGEKYCDTSDDYFSIIDHTSIDLSKYENTKFGFKLEYPSEFVIENQDQSGHEGQPTESLERSNDIFIKDNLVSYEVPGSEQSHIKWEDHLRIQIRNNPDDGNEPYDYAKAVYDENYRSQGPYVYDFREIGSFLGQDRTPHFKCSNKCSTVLGEGGVSLGDFHYSVYYVQRDDYVLIFTVRNNSIFSSIIETLEFLD